LIAAVALLSMLAGMTTLALRRLEPVRDETDPVVRLADARRAALREARPVTIVVRVAGVLGAVTAMPDGSVVAARELGVDRLTGGRSSPAAATREVSDAP
jgi:hypothetical protein